MAQLTMAQSTDVTASREMADTANRVVPARQRAQVHSIHEPSRAATYARRPTSDSAVRLKFGCCSSYSGCRVSCSIRVYLGPRFQPPSDRY